MTNRWIVPSETDKNKSYEVVRVGDLFACSCPNHIYRNRQCKHILKIKAKLEEKNKLREEEKEDKMDGEYLSSKEGKETLERLLKKDEFIPLEEV